MGMRYLGLIFSIGVIAGCASRGPSSSKLAKYEGAGTDIYFRIQAPLERVNALEMAFVNQWPGLSQCFEHNVEADELDDMYFKATFLGFGRKGELKSLRMIELRPSNNELKSCLLAELGKIQISKTGVGTGSIELSMQPLGSKGGPALKFPYGKNERVLQK